MARARLGRTRKSRRHGTRVSAPRACSAAAARLRCASTSCLPVSPPARHRHTAAHLLYHWSSNRIRQRRCFVPAGILLRLLKTALRCYHSLANRIRFEQLLDGGGRTQAVEAPWRTLTRTGYNVACWRGVGVAWTMCFGHRRTSETLADLHQRRRRWRRCRTGAAGAARTAACYRLAAAVPAVLSGQSRPSAPYLLRCLPAAAFSGCVRRACAA